MGYNKRNTTLILIITIVSVLGLSIAFAAFSSTLTISSSAKVTPESGDFKVVFSSKSDSLSTTGVTVTKTGNATAGTPTIDNSTNPTISGISANFTSPGEKVEYTFYARNEGSYDAYLSSVVFDNIKGKSVFKECVAGEGTSSSMVESACNGIKVTTTVLNTAYTSTTLNITGHTLKKNSSEAVKVTIEYTSGSTEADGPFRIDFGNIYLTYGSTSLSGMPTLPTEPICTAVTTSTTGNVPTGSFNYGDEYTCHLDSERTFFVLETNGDNVSLIMDRNFTDKTVDKVAWCIRGEDNNTTCENITSKDGFTPLNYIQNIFGADVEVSFPSYSQIYNSGEVVSGGVYTTVSATWLYGNLADGDAYWLSTPYNGDGENSNARIVTYQGYLFYNPILENIGVRPVITLSKSLIK